LVFTLMVVVGDREDRTLSVSSRLLDLYVSSFPQSVGTRKRIENKVGNYKFCKSLYLYQIGLDFPAIHFPLTLKLTFQLKCRFLNISHYMTITKSIMSRTHRSFMQRTENPIVR